jgi:hypothetical protein
MLKRLRRVGAWGIKKGRASGGKMILHAGPMKKKRNDVIHDLTKENVSVSFAKLISLVRPKTHSCPACMALLGGRDWAAFTWKSTVDILLL